MSIRTLVRNLIRGLHVRLLYGLGFAGVLVLLGASTAGGIKDRMAEARLQEPFFAGCAKAGLSRSAAATEHASLSCVGTWRGAPVIVSWYPGSDRYPTLPAILISMQVPVLDFVKWGVEIGAPNPRFFGAGGGEDEARRALPESLLKKAEGMPGAALFPFQNLARDSEFKAIVEQNWPQGWKGLVLRAAAQQNYPWEQISRTLDRMYSLQVAVVQSVGPM